MPDEMTTRHRVERHDQLAPPNDVTPVRLSHGQLEARVMEALWDRGGWQTPGEVHAVVATERPLAYVTTMTVLVRLWRKGRLERQRDGRAYAYRPVRSREEQAAIQMTEALIGVENRPAALTYFLQSMSPIDRDQLRRSLRRLEAT